MFKFVLTADIGGSKIAAARVERSGRITHALETPTPREGGRTAVDAVIGLLERLPQAGICALGVDVPGLASPDGRVWAPNIAGWKDVPLGVSLRRRFRLPVIVESDRSAFVVGEAWRGVARKRRDVIFLIVGTGIGAGILSSGQLIKGHAGLAGAVGWMAVRDQFSPEYESVGCLESLSAGPGISRAATRYFRRKINSRELVARAHQGDENARQLLREAGHHLGLGLANLVSTLNPEIIVIGGGVAGAGEALLAPARQTMRRWAQPLAVRQVRVVRGRLGAQAGLLGMAKLAFDYYDSLRPSAKS